MRWQRFRSHMVKVLFWVAGMALGSISDHGRGSLGHFTVEVRARYNLQHSGHSPYILRLSCLDLQDTLS